MNRSSPKKMNMDEGSMWQVKNKLYSQKQLTSFIICILFPICGFSNNPAPVYLDQGSNRSLTPELLVNQNTPPMFLFATTDDSWGNSALVMVGDLRDAGSGRTAFHYPKGSKQDREDYPTELSSRL